MNLNDLIGSLPKDEHKAAVDVPYDIFMKTDYAIGIRRATLDRVAITLLRHIGTAALDAFYRDHIVEIMETIDAKTNRVNERMQLFFFDQFR